MAYDDPLARCHLRPPFHTGPTCRIHREGAPDWTRIGYSENNVVGYVMQNEVSLAVLAAGTRVYASGQWAGLHHGALLSPIFDDFRTAGYGLHRDGDQSNMDTIQGCTREATTGMR